MGRAGVLAALLSTTLCMPQAMADSATDNTEARIAELERQVKILTQMLQAQQQTIQVTTERLDVTDEQVAVTESVADTDLSGQSGTKISYGGFIKLDAIYSDYTGGKPTNTAIEDFFVTPDIPVGGPESARYTSTNMTAGTTRFYFASDTDADVGNVSTLIEMDFTVSDQGNERISNSWANRLRHALVKWNYDNNKSILAGQYWSTFQNESVLPANVDIGAPVGSVFVRQAQLRWGLGNFMLAAENSRTVLNGMATDDLADGLPDLVIRYNNKAGDLNWSTAGILRSLTFDNGLGGNDQMYGYGLSLAGKWTLPASDVRFMLNYGDALGRYMGLNAFNDGYVNNQGQIATFEQMGGFIAYRKVLSDRWEAAFTLAVALADNPEEQDYAGAADLARRYQTGHLNLKYSATDALSFAGELIYGEKELEGGLDGEVTRLLMSVKYGL